MVPSPRQPCLSGSRHARKNRHSTRAGGSARATLNMGDMFGQPAEPIISLRWRFFSFCFDARRHAIHRASPTKNRNTPRKETFRLPIGIRANGMEGPTGVSADQGCCRWPFMDFLQGMVKNQPTIFSGRTHSSNCASVTKPSARADAFSVVPSLCAFLAICAALS